MRLIKGPADRRDVLQEYKIKAIYKRYFPVVDLPRFLFNYGEVDYSQYRLRNLISTIEPKIEIKLTSELFRNEDIRININMQNIHFEDVKRVCQKIFKENYTEDKVDELLKKYHEQAKIFVKHKLKIPLQI